eukprot:gene13493-15490_t
MLAALALALLPAATLPPPAAASVGSGRWPARGAGGGNRTLRGAWLEISIGAGTFSVADHGAKGDGEHDDTVAIQKKKGRS